MDKEDIKFVVMLALTMFGITIGVACLVVGVLALR